MKLNFLTISILVTTTFYGCADSNKNILVKMNKNLETLTKIKYDAELKNFNPMTDELGKYEFATAFFDFSSNDSILGSKYLFSRSYGVNGYNGVKTFYTINEKQLLTYKDVNSYEDLVGIPFLKFSIQNLRKLMPKLLVDSSILFSYNTDTVVDGTDCYKYDIKMTGKSINMSGELHTRDDETEVRNLALMIDKTTAFPRQFISYFEDNSPLWIVSYSNLEFPEVLPDSLFDYSLFNKDYIKYSLEEYRTALNNDRIITGNSHVGKKAMDWTLPSMDGDLIKLSQTDSKLTLLEFWFPNCTGCLAAIPDINEIYNSYKPLGLQVYGVEFTKSDSTNLGNYITKRKIKYPTLYAGKQVALDYGVSAAPALFLINDQGEFIYSSVGFRKEGVIKAIENNI
ncbi:MAG: peroxiredoxin [Cyclobacteriaceae bacterium]|jgi:peroxiredoxin